MNPVLGRKFRNRFRQALGVVPDLAFPIEAAASLVKGRNADIPSELQDCRRTASSMKIQIRLRPILAWAIGLMVAGAIAWWVAIRFLVLTD